MDAKEGKIGAEIVAAILAAGAVSGVQSVGVSNGQGGYTQVPVQPNLDGTDPGQKAKVQLTVNLFCDFLPPVCQILADNSIYPDPVDPAYQAAAPSTAQGLIAALTRVVSVPLVSSNPGIAAGLQAALAGLSALAQGTPAPAAAITVPPLSIPAPAPSSPATPAQPATSK